MGSADVALFPNCSLQESSNTWLMNFLAQVLVLKSTAYADDMTVFLIDSGKPHALLDILVLYSQAFNARLNHHKTLAVLLSG